MELMKLRGIWMHTSSGSQTRDCRAEIQLYVVWCGLLSVGEGLFVAKDAKVRGERCSFRVMLRIAASGLRSVDGWWRLPVASPAILRQGSCCECRGGRRVLRCMVSGVFEESGSRIMTLSRDSGVGGEMKVGVLWVDPIMSSVNVI